MFYLPPEEQNKKGQKIDIGLVNENGDDEEEIDEADLANFRKIYE
jgi:hypothetical protein